MTYAKIGIHIFHRDLRLYDNTSLYKLASICDHVIPVFIFDPRQIDPKRNPYFSSNCVQFMVETLEDLANNELKKYDCNTPLLYKGDPIDVLTHLKSKISVSHLSMNMDYTPFAQKRDKEILDWCKKHDIETIYEEDITLLPIGSVRTASSNEVFKVFTPYFRAASKVTVRSPSPPTVFGKTSTSKFRVPTNFVTHLRKYSISMKDAHTLYTSNSNLAVRGGRTNGLRIISNIDEHKNYNRNRDTPSIASTMLSAHNKFGTISIRELHEAIVKKLGKDNHLYTQLFWRDFYYNIAYAFPHVFGHAFRPKYDGIRWENSITKFNAWKEGRTGVPIIDAGMRQLNTTGFMHNRLRMMVSMYLVKDLHIDWQWGERYFATKLVDYDPAQNNGGWQWSASTGTDSQPYFRIFNPYTMTGRVDSDGSYIHRWIPELHIVNPRDFAKWDNPRVRERYDLDSIGYPSQPIVEHDVERKKTLELFKNL
jgi:deoxyribodipyrimidine photo-lyase